MNRRVRRFFVAFEATVVATAAVRMAWLDYKPDAYLIFLYGVMLGQVSMVATGWLGQWLRRRDYRRKKR